MLRNLLKRKGFTIINLLGLSSGMAICLLLVLYIQNELGYDNFHERGDQIYRLAMERKYPGRSAFRGGIPPGIGPAVKKEFPEVLESTRVGGPMNLNLKVGPGDRNFREKNVFMVDSNFFSVFSGKFLQGDVKTALSKPGTVVLNESTAKRYFGSAEKAIGKQIFLSESFSLTVAGICQDWPEKSHFLFNILWTSANTGMEGWNKPEYVYFGPHDYLLLNKNSSASALEAKLPLIVDKYVSSKVERLFGEPYDKFISEGNGYRYFLQPIKEIHLHSDLEDEFRPTSSIQTLRIFIAVAAFILFLACINFINLSTALSVERAREVGIRKTFGSYRSALVWQFLFESVLFSLVSMMFAILLAYLLTPLMNKISGNDLSLTYYFNPLRFTLVLVFSILVGIVAGLYPAFVISSFQPILVLKSRFKSNRRGILLRNGLVIFQFSISVILIICTIVINRQMQYVLGDRLGFRKENIIMVENLYNLERREPGQAYTNKKQAFVDEISKMRGVEYVSACDLLPGSDDAAGGATWVAVENNNSRTDKTIQVDDNYAKLLGLELKEGRFFSREFTTDSFSIVLNETAVRDFGLKNPIGAKLISKEGMYNPPVPGNAPPSEKGQYVFTVEGVVKDYHYQSLYKKIAPLVFVNSNKFNGYTAGIRVQGGKLQSVISDLKKIWHQMDPKDDFMFSFLDQNLAAQYKTEQREQIIITVFSILAILIACIGLFGLATFATLQRTKEISIRKVLGAMPGNLVMILSRGFLSLVLIASLISLPLAWWAMHAWLQNFEYRSDLSWWIFFLAGSIAAMIAILTVSYQAIRAAFANPLKSLRTE
ncbi:MAG: ABC transporter permease [Chitinophagales bacterium]